MTFINLGYYLKQNEGHISKCQISNVRVTAGRGADYRENLYKMTFDLKTNTLSKQIEVNSKAKIKQKRNLFSGTTLINVAGDGTVKALVQNKTADVVNLDISGIDYK